MAKKIKTTDKLALSLRLPKTLHGKIKSLADIEKRSINMQAEILLERGLEAL